MHETTATPSSATGAAELDAAVIGAFRPHLGADAPASERIWMEIHGRFRDQGQKGLMIAAPSGIDIAWWDLKGKPFEAPVHVLMGGALRKGARPCDRHLPTGRGGSD